MKRAEFEVELERIGGKVDRTTAVLPSMHKGQRLNVLVNGVSVPAKAIEVIKLPSGESIKWKLIARELPQ